MSKKLLKYGQIGGGDLGFPITVAASQSIVANMSKFVYRTGGAATATLVDTGTTRILGHLEIEGGITTDGTEVRKCVDDPTAIFRVPVSNGTYAETMKGKKCDLTIVSGVQKAALLTSTVGHLVIVEGDLDNNYYVDVRINQALTKDGV